MPIESETMGMGSGRLQRRRPTAHKRHPSGHHNDPHDAHNLSSAATTAYDHEIRNVRLSDRRLVELTRQATTSINWVTLRNSVAAWDKKKSKETPQGGDFTVYTKRSAATHYVVAIGKVPCSITEMKHVLLSTTTEQYTRTMRECYGSEFIEGMVVHRADTNRKRRSASTATIASAAGGSSGKNVQKENQEREQVDLMVKTATFQRPHMFARHHEWCYVELFQPRQDTTGFVLSLQSLNPDDVFAGKSSASNVSQMQNVFAAYSVELAANGESVRVIFYAEINHNHQHSSHHKQPSGFTSVRTLMTRLTQMAEATNRLSMLVRRRRLGAQSLIAADNVDNIPLLSTNASNSRCKVCSKSLHVLKKKRLCRLCGWFVCESCSTNHQLERRHCSILVVEICHHCLERVDTAQYDRLPPEGIAPPTVEPDSVHGEVSNGAVGLTKVLRKTLENAPEQKRVALKNVMKYLIEDQSQQSSQLHSHWDRHNHKNHHRLILPVQLTDKSSDREYIRALETHLHVDVPPLEQCVVASVDCRTYTMDFKSDATQAPHYPVPPNEDKRASLVRIHCMTEICNATELEIVCTLASRELDCALVMVTVLTDHHMYVVASSNATYNSIMLPREQSFCSHTIMSDKPLMIPYPEADIRFSQLDSIKKHGYRFYSGFPLKDTDGTVFGSVCCADYQLKRVMQSQYATMQKLAATAAKILLVRTKRR